jgi:hypothetical protein
MTGEVAIENCGGTVSLTFFSLEMINFELEGMSYIYLKEP